MSEMGVVGLSSSRRRLVEMSMQFASARLFNGGDGIGVSDSSMDVDPAGSRCCSGQGAKGRSCRVSMCVSGTGCCSVRRDGVFREKSG
jgi:hypothetical protein